MGNRKSIDKILKASNEIAMKTRKPSSNFVLLNSEAIKLINDCVLKSDRLNKIKKILYYEKD